MKFDIAANNYRYDFIRSGTTKDACWIAYFLFRFAVNTLVLTAVLAWIDFYFNRSAAVGVQELVTHNLKLAIIGLIAIPVAYPVALAGGIVFWLFTRGDGQRYLGLVALLLAGAVVVVVKSYFISKLGLTFAYPAAVVFAQAFLILSLRSYVENYGVRCREMPAKS